MVFFNIFYFLSLINFIFSKIELPFKVTNFQYSDEDPEKFISNYFYKDISLNISIGESPQIIPLQICLGEFNTFLISKDCKNYKGIFNQNISKTYKPLEEKPTYYTFEIFDSGIIAQDNFKFENNDINELNFMNVFSLNDNDYNVYSEVITQSGILGFLLEQNRNTDEDLSKVNFIKQLKNKKLISNYNFYFDLYPNDTGKIIIGEDEKESFYLFQSNRTFSTITVSYIDFNLDWAFTFDEIYFGEERFPKDDIGMSLLRIEFGFIKGNYKMQKYIEEGFFNDLIEVEKCFKKIITIANFGSSLYYYFCNKDIDIKKFPQWKFSINQFRENFTFTYEDLFLDIDDKYIFLMTFNAISTIYLGYPFFKKYKFIFNPDDKTLGYYGYIEQNNNEEQNNTVYIVVISFLSVVLLGLGIFAYVVIFVIKKKKKYAKELYDETDNNNINNNVYNNEGLIPSENTNETKN